MRINLSSGPVSLPWLQIDHARSHAWRMTIVNIVVIPVKYTENEEEVSW